MVTCPVCRTHITQDKARYCHHCGRPIKKEEQQLTSERLKMLGGELRILSIIFVSFNGFEKLLSEHSKAQVMLDIRTCLNETDDIIKKLGGTSNQILPDMRVLGIFGAPKAHPDDPARAVRCAWRIRAWWGEHKRKYSSFKQINIGIGINTGRAFFGHILEKAAFLTVIGDTINTAARLTEMCPANEIMISDATYGKTADIIECEHIGRRSVKGKAEQIDLYIVKQIKDVAAVATQTTPYVGRKEELQSLVGYVQSLSDNKEQFCIISGQMGIGKSRLKEEFTRYLVDQGNIHFMETHCSSEVRSPYFPFKFLLRRYFLINEYDADDIVAQKIENTIARTDLTANDIKGFKHLFLTDVQHLGQEDLISINENICTSVKNLIHYECRQSPYVLIFEEFNRADTMSKNLVAYLATELVDDPVLFLMVNVSRDFLKDVSVDIHEIALKPLTKDDIRNLIIAILEDADDRLIDFMYRSAGGNPLFTIEAIRNTQRTNLIHKISGRWQLEREQRLTFLDDLYGVVMSTIDSLPADYRLIVDFASVIGYSFSARILTQLLDSTYLNEQLRYLIEEGYIVLTQNGQDPMYVFRHNLLKDAAYTVLPLRKRKEIHARVAQLFEELYADRLSEFYEQIGHHYMACDNHAKAASYFISAGNKAKNLFAIDQALNYYSSVLKFEQEKQYELSVDERQGILMNFTDIYEILGDIQKMEKYAEQGLEIARSQENHDLEKYFNMRLARALFLKNEYSRAEEILLTLIEECTDQRQEMLPVLYAELGYVYQFKYEYEKSMINYNLSWNTARSAKDISGEVSCLCNLAQLHIDLGNYEQALEYIDYCLDELLPPEAKRWRIQFTYMKGELFYRIWDLERSEKHLVECHKQADEVGYMEYCLRSALDLAYLKSLGNENVDVRSYITTVDSKVTFLIRDQLLTDLNYKKALLFYLGQDDAKAKDYLASAITGAERLDQKEVLVLGYLLLSRLEEEKSIDHALQALEIADTIKMPPLIAQALYRLTEIYRSMSDTEKARYYGRKALLVYDDVKSKLPEEYHESFSNLPEYVSLLGL
jgi:predicted ATPase/class 3 adenylate cyclase